MLGGGFLRQAMETFKYNRSLLRKTTDKRADMATLRSPGGKLESRPLTQREKEELDEMMQQWRKQDIKRNIIISATILLIVLALVLWILGPW